MNKSYRIQYDCLYILGRGSQELRSLIWRIKLACMWTVMKSINRNNITAVYVKVLQVSFFSKETRKHFQQEAETGLQT